MAGFDLAADVFAAAGFLAADFVAVVFADFAGAFAAAVFAGALAAGFGDFAGAFAAAPFAGALLAAALAAPGLAAGFAVDLRFVVVVGVLAKLSSLVEARRSRSDTSEFSAGG